MRKRTTQLSVPASPEAELFLELQRNAIFFSDGLCLSVLFRRHSDLEWCLGALNQWQPVS